MPKKNMKMLTNDYKCNTEDLNSRANKSCKQLGALRRPKHIAMDQLPSSLFQCVILIKQHSG